MPDKPSFADGYRSEQVDLVRATCLYVATKLGDLMDDLVVVGGLAPSLLIDPSGLVRGTDPHVGTLDLDVGLAVALLDQGRYRTITERLRRAGFSQDVNAEGNPTRQRWTIEGIGRVTVDFLIPPTQPGDVGGALRNIEADFAAVIAPGLHLAFRDRRRVPLSGQTIMGEDAARDVWVCGPGAYVVLKALAFGSRGENKDAYDLFYVVRNFGSGIEDVAACLRPLLEDSAGVDAVAILRRDFLDHNGLGPRRVAEFLTRGPDDAIQADVVGFVGQLLDRCD
ncbi:hypothetical protein CO151_10570 [bacterium CG_4_9_14_3_um_filter_65_15]|nr:MAG: hypothetical protein CO151_10570 [bacterium CG_4_9_14_3_um_filter_65_15]